MKKLFITSLLFLCIANVQAQDVKTKYDDNVKTLESTLETLYAVISGEKGEARDWELFKFLFKPNAKLIPTGRNKEGTYGLRYMTPEDYIKTSGTWLFENGFF